MPAARGTKRSASKTSTSTASLATKNKKKRGIQLEIPSAPTAKGRVLTCGQGDVGQLGLGEDVIETTKFKFVSALGDNIVDICAGGMHTIALDSDGQVWSFGCNDEGALGRETGGDGEEGTPAKVTLQHPAVQVAAGDSHSAALLDNGDVYAWGAFRDSHGSMGLVMRGREGKASRDPVKVDVGETAAGIASGGDHLVILTTSGAVFTMGCGEQGQLGRLSQRSASRDTRQGFSALLVPTRVTLRGGAARVWAGYHATFALDAAQEKLFAWGLNNYGQLGVTGEKRKGALYTPTECDAFAAAAEGRAPWRQLACGQHHSLALDALGNVYAVGRCEYGRLGLGDRTGDAETPELVPKLQNKKCISIATGTSNSFAVTDSGTVFGWGMGSEGQLGSGASEDAAEPTPAALPPGAAGPARPARVAAGGQHTVLLMTNGKQEKAQPAKAKKEKAVEKVEDRPRPKRQKIEQEASVTSTSSAQPELETELPQKLNGDKEKENLMEIDETDNQESIETENEETKIETDETKIETDETKIETDETKIETEESKIETEETKIETNETTIEMNETKTETENVTPNTEDKVESDAKESETSQDLDSDAKSQDTEDIEMEEKLNGVETKSAAVAETSAVMA